MDNLSFCHFVSHVFNDFILPLFPNRIASLWNTHVFHSMKKSSNKNIWFRIFFHIHGDKGASHAKEWTTVQVFSRQSVCVCMCAQVLMLLVFPKRSGFFSLSYSTCCLLTGQTMMISRQLKRTNGIALKTVINVNFKFLLLFFFIVSSISMLMTAIKVSSNTRYNSLKSIKINQEPPNWTSKH